MCSLCLYMNVCMPAQSYANVNFPRIDYLLFSTELPFKFFLALESYPPNFFSSHLIVLLSFISCFAIVRLQIDSNMTGLKKTNLDGHCSIIQSVWYLTIADQLQYYWISKKPARVSLLLLCQNIGFNNKISLLSFMDLTLLMVIHIQLQVPSNFFISHLVALLSFIRQFALVRQQIDSITAGLLEKKLDGVSM